MNPSTLPKIVSDLICNLRSYLAICEDVMALVSQENRSLAGAVEYHSFEFYQLRKNLLPRLGEAFISLRGGRQTWQQMGPTERATYPEVKSLLQSVQSLLMKILLLDRENQQALLRRGLVPATHLPSPASQQPHYVANLYRRHTGH